MRIYSLYCADELYNQNKDFNAFNHFQWLQRNNGIKKHDYDSVSCFCSEKFCMIILQKKKIPREIWLKCKIHAEGYVNNPRNFLNHAESTWTMNELKGMIKFTHSSQPPEPSPPCNCESDTFVRSFFLSFFLYFLHNRLKWIGKIFHFNWWNKSTPNLSCEFLSVLY